MTNGAASGEGVAAMHAATPVEKAWLAGVIEGEGHFSSHPRYDGRPNDQPRPRVSVKMTDRDVIERVAEICGGAPIRQVWPSRTCRREQYRVDIYGGRAVAVMEAVYPHMGARRRRQISSVMRERTAS